MARLIARGQSCSASYFSAVASEARESSGLLPNEVASDGVAVVGATCDLTNDYGTFSVVTPASVIVHRSSKELQVIAHQVWRVRNKYFGHGDVSSNLYANLTKSHAEAVAKQVLVARYLCRKLIDLHSPSNTFLAREMGLFFGSYSGNFAGQLQELREKFKVNFDRPIAKIYDEHGVEIETYDFNQ